MVELKVEYLKPEELTPYENNTRKHAPDDIEAIKKSILEDGFNDPIGIWGGPEPYCGRARTPDRRHTTASGQGSVHPAGSYERETA